MTYWLTANTLHCSLWCNCAIVFGKFWPLIWQRIACSVREQPLYPQPPAGQLKITPRHNSHKMKLHCEESCPFSTKTVTCVSSVDFIYELGVTELPQYCLVHQAVMKKKTLCISLKQHTGLDKTAVFDNLGVRVGWNATMLLEPNQHFWLTLHYASCFQSISQSDLM